MADIDVSKIKLPGDNNDYILKDATARADAPKVTQTNVTDNNYYRLLLSNSSNDNNEKAIAKKSGNLTFSPGYSSLILNGSDVISRIVVQHSNNNSSQPVANAAEIKLSDSCNDGGYLDGDTGGISLYTCFDRSVLRAYYTHNNTETSKDILKILHGSSAFLLGDCLVKEYVDNLEDTIKSTLIDLIYPIGSIFISVNNTNPGTYLTGTTWVAFATGKTLVGVDTNDTDFNTVEKTGGTKSVTLTSAQSGVPSHNHTLGSTSLSMFKSKINNVSYGLSNGGGFAGDVIVGQNTGNTTVYMLSSGSVQNNTAKDATTSHTNLQPYITTYMWKRTA